MKELYKGMMDSPLFFIVGPCVLDTKENAIKIAKRIKALRDELGVLFIYKASFDKANRQSVTSYRGLGLEESAKILEQIKEEYQLPILTDIHEPTQAKMVAFADVIQIPAFLCRQTDVLVAAGHTNKIVNIKKGQFMSAEQMKGSLEKVYSTSNKKVFLTERGNFFGYGDLVVDFRNIQKMKELGVPVIFDATHSVQKPGGKGNSSGGAKEFIEPYAYASLEFGASGLFMEVHPEPAKALCDGDNSLDLDTLSRVVKTALRKKRGV